jgi:hypothetical protein
LTEAVSKGELMKAVKMIKEELGWADGSQDSDEHAVNSEMCTSGSIKADTRQRGADGIIKMKKRIT